MAGSYIIPGAVLLLITLLAISTQAEPSLTFKSTPNDPTYVYLGKNLSLNVTYYYNGTLGVTVQWLKGSVRLVKKRTSDEIIRLPGSDGRDSIEGQATFVLTNIKLQDNGTYRVQLDADDASTQLEVSLEVIVVVQPTAHVSCPSNNKIKEGENFSCFCNGTTGNPPPLAKWSKNGVVTNGNKFKTKELAFENVTKHISGNYTCVVRSHNLTDSKVIELLVQYSPKDVRIGTNISNKYIEVNTTVAITCTANAFPEANYTISRNGITLASANAMYIINSVKSNDSGRYDCVAENIIGKTSKSFQLNVKGKPTIKKFSSGQPDDKVTLGSAVTIRCEADGLPSPYYELYHDGSKIEKDIIHGAYTITSVEKRHNGSYQCVAKNRFGNVTASFDLAVRVKPSEEDIKFPKDAIDAVLGKKYTLTCYADVYPKPTYTLSHNGLSLTSVNDGVYVIDQVKYSSAGDYKCVVNNELGNATKSYKLVVKDAIKDEETGELPTIASTNSGGKADKLSSDNVAILLVLMVVIVIVVVILAIVIVYNRRRKQQLSARKENLRNDLQRQPHKESMPGIPLENVHSGPAGNIDGPEEDCFSWREIPRDDLNMGRFLGQGEFSNVVKAVWTDEEKDAHIPVAVKTVKDNATEVDRKELFKELKLMADVTQHPNVVNLLGACSKGGPLWVIVEFCEHGNLLSYIRNNRKALFEDDRPFMSSLDLVTRARFAYDVSKGMSHLEKMKIVHRDLAARNVLLGRNKIAKVSDFGLSRDIYETGLYQKSTGGKLPVRWMAIESLQQLTYSFKSDVWSFGVMFWEIETAGLIPYAGIAGLDLSKHLQRGYRLPKPTETLPELYEIMKTCWESNSEERPSFKELRIKLESFMEQNSDCLQVEDEDNADDDVANVLNYVEIVESE